MTETNAPSPVDPVASGPSSSPTPMSLVCPRCEGSEIREARAHAAKDLIHGLGNIAYRCRNCRTRFYAKGVRSKLSKDTTHKRPIPFWRRPKVQKTTLEVFITAIFLLLFMAFLYMLSGSGSQPSGGQ